MSAAECMALNIFTQNICKLNAKRSLENLEVKILYFIRVYFHILVLIDF